MCYFSYLLSDGPTDANKLGQQVFLALGTRKDAPRGAPERDGESRGAGRNHGANFCGSQSVSDRSPTARGRCKPPERRGGDYRHDASSLSGSFVQEARKCFLVDVSGIFLPLAPTINPKEYATVQNRGGG